MMKIIVSSNLTIATFFRSRERERTTIFLQGFAASVVNHCARNSKTDLNTMIFHHNRQKIFP